MSSLASNVVLDQAPTRLAISKSEFMTLFPGRERHWKWLTTKPKTEAELQARLRCKLWRLNNLYTIIDKYGDPVIFKMNRAQFVTYAHLAIHPRLCILKSRQQGISTLFLVSFFDDTLWGRDLNIGLMAQDADAADKLLDRTKTLWERLSPWIKERVLRRKCVRNNTSEFSFDNNSTIFIRTSFRSTTLQRLHISELGKIANARPERAKETKRGSLQALAPGNAGIVESTAEGANMFKEMWESAVANKMRCLVGAGEGGEGAATLFQQLWSAEGMWNIERRLAAKDFYPVFLSWLYDPDCVELEPQEISPEHAEYFLRIEAETGVRLTVEQKWFWIAQERELGGDIHQEYPATPEEAFAAAKDGTYWARKYVELVVRRGQRVVGLWDAGLDLYCAMDLGRNDFNVLVFFQFYKPYGSAGQIRIVGEYYNSGEGMEHYANYILELERTRGWRVKEVVLPHDARVIELGSRGRSREDILWEEGVTNTRVLAKLDKRHGIDSVRSRMGNIWIDSSCVYIEKCILGYTKEWNELLGVWRDESRRDENAHGADAVRYMEQYVDQYLASWGSEGTEKGGAGYTGVAL